MRTLWTTALLCAGLLLTAPARAQTVKIGSKNFTEQYIAAEIYAQALEGAGIKVERRVNLGRLTCIQSTPAPRCWP